MSNHLLIENRHPNKLSKVSLPATTRNHSHSHSQSHNQSLEISFNTRRNTTPFLDDEKPRKGPKPNYQSQDSINSSRLLNQYNPSNLPIKLPSNSLSKGSLEEPIKQPINKMLRGVISRQLPQKMRTTFGSNVSELANSKVFPKT
jgi:hypothetical protein